MLIINLKQFLSFNECQNLIEKYEINRENKQVPQFSLFGFINYMDDNFLMDPRKQQVYQDDEYPLNFYFINSSHNT